MKGIPALAITLVLTLIVFLSLRHSKTHVSVDNAQSAAAGVVVEKRQNVPPKNKLAEENPNKNGGARELKIKRKATLEGLIQAATLENRHELWDAIVSDKTLSSGEQKRLLNKLFERLGELDFFVAWEFAREKQCEGAYLPSALLGWAGVDSVKALHWALNNRSIGGAKGPGSDNVYLTKWATGAFKRSAASVIQHLAGSDSPLQKSDVLLGLEEYARLNAAYENVFDAVNTIGDKDLGTSVEYSNGMLPIASMWAAKDLDSLILYLASHSEGSVLRGLLYRTAGREIATVDPMAALKFVSSPSAADVRGGVASVLSTWMNTSGEPEKILNWAMANRSAIPNMDDVLYMAGSRIGASDYKAGIDLVAQISEPATRKKLFNMVVSMHSEEASTSFIEHCLNAARLEDLDSSTLSRLYNANRSGFIEATNAVGDTGKQDYIRRFLQKG